MENQAANEARPTRLRPRKPTPLYYRPAIGRETQWKHRSERIAEGNFPRDFMEEVNAEKPLGWALTHCVFCGEVVASVILEDGREHYAVVMLNTDGKLCAAPGRPHGCNRLFKTCAAMEADRQDVAE